MTSEPVRRMRTYRMHGRGNPDMTVGTHAYYVEVDGAVSEEHAARIAASHPKAKKLSSFWFSAARIADDRWLVKVSYIVDPA
jgi:hypothetical protein